MCYRSVSPFVLPPLLRIVNPKWEGLTVLIDTYFWKKTEYPLWPELFGVYFNVVQGKSAEWGVRSLSFSLSIPFSLPPHTYLTTHLPKLLLSSLPLALLALVTDARIRSLLWPTMVFVGMMSMSGLIIYIVPLWNVAGARAAKFRRATQSTFCLQYCTTLLQTSDTIVDVNCRYIVKLKN